MIQYADDGLTLEYTGPDGKKTSKSWMQAGYGAMLVVMAAQGQAQRENVNAKALYEGALANAQQNVDSGHQVLAPTKPLMKLVADDAVPVNGVVPATMVVFDPPLADLVLPPVQVLVDANAILAARAALPSNEEKILAIVSALARKAGIAV